MNEADSRLKHGDEKKLRTVSLPSAMFKAGLPVSSSSAITPRDHTSSASCTTGAGGGQTKSHASEQDIPGSFLCKTRMAWGISKYNGYFCFRELVTAKDSLSEDLPYVVEWMAIYACSLSTRLTGQLRQISIMHKVHAYMNGSEGAPERPWWWRPACK
jgi:hypothetical protein